jgi:hypothetical protein
MDPHARIAALSDWLRPGSVGAEIGVWKGDFSQAIVDRIEPSQLFLVDPWEYQPEYPSAWYGGGLALQQADMDEIYFGVCARFAAAIADGRVSVVRSRSDEATVPMELDWVYIDGNHTFEAVRTDIDHWSSQTKVGGLVVLDDYGLAGWWEDGVTRAANEACESGRLELVAVHGTQAVLRVTSDAHSAT